MKQLVVYFITYFLLSGCKCQNLNNRLLQSFINDPNICKYVLASCKNSCDTIIIIDTLKYFDVNEKVKFSNREIQIKHKEPSDSTRSKAERFLQSKCEIFITKLDKDKKKFRISYFNKFTNALGFIEYKLKKERFIKTNSQFGQL